MEAAVSEGLKFIYLLFLFLLCNILKWDILISFVKNFQFLSFQPLHIQGPRSRRPFKIPEQSAAAPTQSGSPVEIHK